MPVPRPDADLLLATRDAPPTEADAPPAIAIRRAGSADWPAVARLLREYAAWMAAHAGFDPFAVQPAFAVELADLGRHYADPRRALFVASSADGLHGCIAVVRHDGGDAEIKRMYVQPAARGRGIADALVDAALGHAAGTGCEETWLESVPGPMDAAIAVYTRHGFRPVEGDPTIAVDETVLMRRSLRGVASTTIEDAG